MVGLDALLLVMVFDCVFVEVGVLDSRVRWNTKKGPRVPLSLPPGNSDFQQLIQKCSHFF